MESNSVISVLFNKLGIVAHGIVAMNENLTTIWGHTLHIDALAYAADS